MYCKLIKYQFIFCSSANQKSEAVYIKIGTYPIQKTNETTQQTATNTDTNSLSYFEDSNPVILPNPKIMC